MMTKHKMNLTTLTGIGAIAAMTMVSAPQADAILIDNFNEGTGALLNTNQSDGMVQAGPGGNDTDLETGLSVLNVLGGSRQMDIPGVIPVSGTGTLTARANASNSGLLSFSLDAGTSGSAIITWNANGAGLNADFTDGGTSSFFSFDIVAIDQGLVDLIVIVNDGTNTDSHTISNAGVGEIKFPFTVYTGIDFTNIFSVSLEIQGQDASDLTLDQFFTAGDETPSIVIPEPATLSLLSLATVALLGRRRRQAMS